MADKLDSFHDFVAQARARLAQGRQEYGDKSFSADPLDLIHELQQEALDMAGWGFILWQRLEDMKAAMLRADTIPPAPPSD